MHPLIKANADPVFKYLFGIIGKYEFRALLGKEHAKAVWKVAASDGYLLKHCKLYAYANKVKGSANSKAYQIDSADVRLLRGLDLSSMKPGCSPKTLAEFDVLEESILVSPAMNAHIGKFISKKLLFLTKSYGLNRADIRSQMIYAAIFALRKQYPFFQSDLHATNICKAAIHNCGIGIIEYWTRSKRQALLKENGSFQAVNLSLDVIADIGLESPNDDEDKLNLGALIKLSSKLPREEQRFVSLACGQMDLGFSMFLGVDNADAVEEWKYDRYLKQLCEYLKFEEARSLALLNGLRNSMA